MNRRDFFAFLPVAPIVAMNSVEVEAKPDISAGAPRPGEFNITIQGSLKPKPIASNIASNSIGGFYFNENDPNRGISMAVGEDGGLWIRSLKGQWKKVVTE